MDEVLESRTSILPLLYLFLNLKKSKVNSQLTEKEKLLLKLDWLKKFLRKADKIENNFLSKITDFTKEP